MKVGIKLFSRAVALFFFAFTSAAAQDTGQESLRDAIKNCADQVGLKPLGDSRSQPPPRLSYKQKVAMDSCLEGLGIQPSDFPPPPPRNDKFLEAVRLCLAAKGINLPEFVPGQRPPALTDAEQSALDECHDFYQGLGNS
jgi:hypothetical protein